MEVMCLNPLTKQCRYYVIKYYFHLQSSVICRFKVRPLCRRCRPHGGRCSRTMGRLWRVKLSAGIRMMAMLTLSKWHPGDRERRRTPRSPSLLCGFCSPPLFAFICIHGPLHFDLRHCRSVLLKSTPDSFNIITSQNEIFSSLFLIVFCWLSDSRRILSLQMNCVQDVQSAVLWSLTPTLSLLNGLQLIGLIPLYTSMCKIPWGICDSWAVPEL